MLLTKLAVPAMPKNIVDRENVDKKLSLLPESKLAFVTAPAGYGKTTAVGNYLSKQYTKLAWFSLAQTDNEPVKFWRFLITSVAIALKDFSYAAISINTELIVSRIIIHFLIDLLKSVPDNITIVIDDYHLVSDEIIEDSFTYFLGSLPPNVSVVIISQSEPEYNNEIESIKIGMKELAFSSFEIKELFGKKGFNLKECEIELLQQYTGGWAEGLAISLFCLEKGNDVHSGIFGDNEYVNKYFHDEVLSLLPDAMKAFLIDTSFINILSGQLCYEITGNVNSKEILKLLARRNSFIIPVDLDNNSYICHPMFKGFLLSELSKKDLEFRNSLYYRAGAWYLANNRLVDAIESYIKAKDFDKALALISDKYSCLALSESNTYRKLIESLPEEVRKSNSGICADYSWILAMNNQLEEAECWVNNAQICYDQRKETAGLDDIEAMEAKITTAYINLAITKMDVSLAEQYFKRISGFRLFDYILTAEINAGEVSMLKTIYGFRGCLNYIDMSYEKYMEALPDIMGDIFSYIAVIVAECQYERNDLQTVYTTLSNNMGRITRLGFAGVIVPCIILLAKDKVAKGRVNEAFDLVESGRRMLTEKNTIWMRYFDLFTAYLYIHIGDAENAKKYLDIDHKCIFDNLSHSCEYEYIVYARYLMLVNNLDESLLLLCRLEEYARTEKRTGSLIEVLTLKAINRYLRGEPSDAMSVLDSAFSLGMADGYVRTFIDEGQIMAELLAKYKTWEKFKGEQRHQKYARMLSDYMNSSIRMEPPIYQAETPETDNMSDQCQLSTREFEVLQLLVAEYSNAEIACELFITERTVKHHNARIYEKLGVKNRLEAILKAREDKLVR